MAIRWQPQPLWCVEGELWSRNTSSTIGWFCGTCYGSKWLDKTLASTGKQVLGGCAESDDHGSQWSLKQDCSAAVTTAGDWLATYQPREAAGKVSITSDVKWNVSIQLQCMYMYPHQILDSSTQYILWEIRTGVVWAQEWERLCLFNSCHVATSSGCSAPQCTHTKLYPSTCITCGVTWE